jgi:unsaturated chondroitin disaccharide hydrolase
MTTQEKKQGGAGATAEMKSVFDFCIRKASRNIEQLANRPASWSFDVQGKYWQWNESFFAIGNWTSSFITGMAILAWRATGDDAFLQQTNRMAGIYKEKVTGHVMDTMHDLGFLYSLYSVALHKLTGDLRHRETALLAADALAARFVQNGRYIRAWGRLDEHGTDYEGLAIIDCMMNLPLLYWASRESGNPKYKEVAVQHADTTLALFVRPDDSVFHAYRFDPATGSPTGGENYCGRAIPSQWARGTAWAIYGFALSYTYTRDSRYLEASRRLARKFLALLDSEVVPVWDFRLPPGEPQIRDSSAAAVAACGLQELLAQGADDKELAQGKTRLLARLCSPDYTNPDTAIAGVLRNGQVGDGVGRAKSVYTSWGDYFLMEALSRELGQGPTFW